MNYIIIEQENLSMVYPVECGDIPAVQREILAKIKEGKTPRVFVEIPFDVSVKVKEDKIGEAPKSKTKPDKVARSESDSEVRRGDEEPPPGLDQGSGDTSASSSAEAG